MATTTDRLTKAEGLAYLVQCADRDGVHYWSGYSYPAGECRTCDGTNDAGHLHTPGSRYGSTSRECAPVAWRVAYLVAREMGEPLSLDDLDNAMSMVVNDHDEVASIVRQYGRGNYGRG